MRLLGTLDENVKDELCPFPRNYYSKLPYLWLMLFLFMPENSRFGFRNSLKFRATRAEIISHLARFIRVRDKQPAWLSRWRNSAWLSCWRNPACSRCTRTCIYAWPYLGVEERDGPFAVFAVPLRNQICILSRGPFLLDGLHTCKRVSVRHETQPSRTIYLFGDVCWINVFLSDE